MELEVNSNADLCPKANLFMYVGFMGSRACGNFKKVTDLTHRYKEQIDGCKREGGWRTGWEKK